jgi:Xaa-Pro aminopeptidase
LAYLTGYTGSFGMALITQDQTILATDHRYAEYAQKQCQFDLLLLTKSLASDLVKANTGTQIQFESHHLTYESFQALTKAFPAIAFIPSAKLVEVHRITKDAHECSLLRQACEISTSALEWLVTTIVVGDTEREIANRLEHKMVELGAEERAFASIVAGGANSAIPHHQPTSYALQSGDFLKIDFGARVDGYHADCTRTFVIGKATQRQVEIFRAVATAQSAGCAQLENGKSLHEIDAAVRAELAAAGMSENFTHGLGHGVGLEIHEDPFFGPNNSGKILPNTALTIEPGAYFSGFGGVRIEDTLIVGENDTRNLCTFTHDLVEL